MRLERWQCPHPGGRDGMGSRAEDREMTGKPPSGKPMTPFAPHTRLVLFPGCLRFVRIPTGVSRIELHQGLFLFGGGKKNKTFINICFLI